LVIVPERTFNIGSSPYDIKDDEWVPSRYNIKTKAADGTLLLYNTLSGAFGGVPEAQADGIREILRNGVIGTIEELGQVERELIDGGFLVRKGVNELRKTEFIRRRLDFTDYLHLVLMPSEDCNFRCVYCYESFPRGRMEPEVVEGVKKLIASRISKLERLMISWFGGEPLSQPDIIMDITDSFLPDVEKYGILYKSSVTTNGYYLTPELCVQLVNRGIRTYNITLDGIAEDHDVTRILKGGGETFDTIMANLRALKKTDLHFKINIRNNFHPKTRIDEFINLLAEEFAGDDRFNVFFRPVGKWGGENDDNLEVCVGKERTDIMYDADLKAVKKGIPVAAINEFIQPLGSVCYAAKPNQFTIGADGQVYKCTVALESDFNKVGKLHGNGYLELDLDKVANWVLGAADEDPTCQTCFYRPSCHGAACPLVRIESNKRPCPHEKTNIKKVLNILWEQNKQFPHKAAEPNTI
jgi:uncharacterized protein